MKKVVFEGNVENFESSDFEKLMKEMNAEKLGKEIFRMMILDFAEEEHQNYTLLIISIQKMLSLNIIGLLIVILILK